MPPTFPILVGGRLRRADAGRGRPVRDGAGTVVGYATTASAAVLAEAVAAARAALPGWSDRSADDRGRVLAGVAEQLDERCDRFAADAGVPADEVAAAADRWLWYAGWTDKIGEIVGGVRPVAGPYVSWSAPRPAGVVGALAPATLPGLVDALGSALAVGATAVVVAPHEQPRAAAALAELLVGTDLPAGVANVLTGDHDALAAELAGAVDRVDPDDVPPDAADPGLARLRAWSQVTTVWQSVGR